MSSGAALTVAAVQPHEHRFSAHNGYCIERNCAADGWPRETRREREAQQRRVRR